jgi:hypothetical protein
VRFALICLIESCEYLPNIIYVPMQHLLQFIFP